MIELLDDLVRGVLLVALVWGCRRPAQRLDARMRASEARWTQEGDRC